MPADARDRLGLGVASAFIIASCIRENGVLKELKCAATAQCMLAFVSAPFNMVRCFCTRSVKDNRLGVEGGKAFAAVLKDTQLTNLK